MDRFMREVAPNFQGKHLQRRAALLFFLPAQREVSA